MNLKWMGGAGLVAGTAIGATVLAMIFIVAGLSLLQVLILFSLGWLTMMLSGLMLAEVCISLPVGHSFLSISEHYWGVFGKWVVTILTAILMFFLLCAYYQFLGADTSLFLSKFFKVQMPPNYLILSFAALFVLSLASQHVILDTINRLLIFLMIFSVGLLFFASWSFLDPLKVINKESLKAIDMPAFLLVINAFGYHIILPSIRSLLGEHDKKDIYKSIIIGSLIPLALYIIWYLWQTMLMPDMTKEDVRSLTTTLKDRAESIIIARLAIQAPYYGELANSLMHFSFVLTSLIGISLSFYHLIKDFFIRLHIRDSFNFIIALLVVVPCVVFTIYDEDGYLVVLKRAGLMVLFLNIYLPAIFVLQKRILHKNHEYKLRYLPTSFIWIYILLISFGLVYELYRTGSI